MNSFTDNGTELIHFQLEQISQLEVICSVLKIPILRLFHYAMEFKSKHGQKAELCTAGVNLSLQVQCETFPLEALTKYTECLMSPSGQDTRD